MTPPRSFPKLLEALKNAPHSNDDGAIPFFESLTPKVVYFPEVILPFSDDAVLVHGFCVCRPHDKLLPRFVWSLSGSFAIDSPRRRFLLVRGP